MTREAISSIIEGNKQILLFLQSFLKKEPQNHGKAFEVHVKDKYEGLPFTIHVYPNTVGAFLLYRVVTKAGKSLWNSWESPEEIENSFRIMSLI